MVRILASTRTVLGVSRVTLSLTSSPKSLLDLRRSNDLNHQKPSGGAEIFMVRILASTRTVLGVSRVKLSLTSSPKSLLDLKRSNDLNHQKPFGGAKILMVTAYSDLIIEFALRNYTKMTTYMLESIH